MKGNRLHTKLRLGMSLLNAHQYQILKTLSPQCTCGHSSENTKHFILHCIHHQQHRIRMQSCTNLLTWLQCKRQNSGWKALLVRQKLQFRFRSAIQYITFSVKHKTLFIEILLCYLFLLSHVKVSTSCIYILVSQA